MTKSFARHLIPGALLALVAVALPGAASAASLGSLLTPVALVSGKAAPCTGRTLTQPFAPWNDSATYFPVPGGNFEGGAPGWTLTGGASIVSGGAPFVAGSAGSSLSLPDGASATAPSVCVDLGAPTLRFFSKGGPSAVLVEVVIGKLALPIGAALPGGGWQPSPAYAYLTNLVSILSPTGTTTVTFRFTAMGGHAQIDDVFVDPYRRT
jgi:hypothetical protein